MTLLRRSHGQRTTSKFWAARGDVGRPRTTTFRSCDVHPPWACVLTCGWAPDIFATAVYVPTLPQACYSTIAWKSNPCTTRVLNHQILLSLSRVQCVAIGPDHHFFSGGLTRNNDCNHDLLLHQMLFEEPGPRHTFLFGQADQCNALGIGIGPCSLALADLQ